MLTSANILKINTNYNEAVRLLKNRETARIEIGNLDKSKLVYLVSPHSIELAIQQKGTCRLLGEEELQVLKAGYADRPAALQLIEIANRLNNYSVLKGQRETSVTKPLSLRFADDSNESSSQQSGY